MKRFQNLSPIKFILLAGLESYLICTVLIVTLALTFKTGNVPIVKEIGTNDSWDIIKENFIRLPLWFFCFIAFFPPIFIVPIYQWLPIFLTKSFKNKKYLGIGISIAFFSLSIFYPNPKTFLSTGLVGGFYFAYTFYFWFQKSTWKAFLITYCTQAIFLASMCANIFILTFVWVHVLYKEPKQKRTFYENDQIKSEIIVRGGIPHGKATYYHENGQIKKTVPHKYGFEHGELKRFYPSGEPKEISKMKMGQYLGMALFYNEDGSYYEFFTKNGKINYGKSYDKDKNLVEESEMMDGKTHGIQKTYYPSGKLKSTFPFKNGKSNGKFKLFYETGALRGTAEYKNHLKDGLEQIYDKEGDLIRKRIFSKDKLVETLVEKEDKWKIEREKKKKLQQEAVEK